MGVLLLRWIGRMVSTRQSNGVASLSTRDRADRASLRVRTRRSFTHTATNQSTFGI